MEIGGDFWLDNIEYRNDCNKCFYQIGSDNYFVMSGRTAIDTVLQDILKNKKIRNVYFPSYACESMMQPFIDREIKINFYNVYFDNTLKYDIDTNYDCDIFFAMNYFGYTSSNMEMYIKEFKKRDVIVIEDITHSLLSQKRYSQYSDYLVCSLRKWFPIICGGLAVKVNGKFKIDFSQYTINNDVIQNKELAMKMKYESIINDNIDKKKNEFLKLYKDSNKSIKEDYINKKIDNQSLIFLLNADLEKIKRIRKKNIEEIYHNLDLNKYQLLINQIDFNKDCLLYVPLYIKKERLGELKKLIYQNKFYCPSHWPIDSKINDLYENELSLICDQRYKANEIVDKLKKMNENL